jgi:Putative Actinobacterial Holin-X, holin superfamily III
MHIRAGNGTGLGGAAKAVSEHVSSIVRLEIELATAELKRKATALGIGVGLLVGAGIFSLFLIGFAFATIAVALALVVDLWAAMLITTGIILVLTAALAIAGITLLQRGTPPVPEQAIEEANLTMEALKNGG